MGFFLSYWKWLVLAALLAAIGVQTIRLDHAQVFIAKLEAAASKFDEDLAKERLASFQEGARQEKEAWEKIEARRAEIAAGLISDANKRAAASAVRAKRIAAALEDAKWACLHEPLPEAVLQEYRR